MADTNAQSSRNVVSLNVVRNVGVSRDTVSCLRTLLARAERGEVIGFSFAAMQADREFFLSNCGEARDPAVASALRVHSSTSR